MNYYQNENDNLIVGFFKWENVLLECLSLTFNNMILGVLRIEVCTTQQERRWRGTASGYGDEFKLKWHN